MPNKTKEIWIQVFKPGTHTDSEGVEREYTLDDVEAIATTYNEAIADDPNLIAPIVKGHPKMEDPAYGWIEKLKLEGEILWAKLSQIVPSFAEEVNNGMFKKVSISLYPDGLLRHLGFLGAVPPAVKGLENVAFASFSSNKKFTAYTIDFADPMPVVTPTATQTLEEYKAEQLARSQKYGIAIKDGLGYATKPEVYKELADEDFADPVNYLYPINDKYNFLASTRSINLWDMPSIEKQIISARLYAKAEQLGFVIQDDKAIYFSEDGETAQIQVPIGMLSKDQLKQTLEQMVKSNLNNENKNILKFMEGNMSEYLKLFTQFITDWLTTNGNPEMASNFQAEAAKWVEQNPEPTTAEPTTTPEGVALAEPNPEVEALKKQVAELEARNRKASFNEFLNGQSNLLPAQRAQLLPILEMAFNQDSTSKVISFSEGGKDHKTTATELVKSFVAALPSTVDFAQNIAGKDDKSKGAKKSDKYTDDSAENHQRILDFQESQRAKGKEISYNIAARIIMTGGENNG